MVIDFHNHAFPEKIAKRAVDTLEYASGGLIPQTDGTVMSLKSEMKKDKVDIAVVLSIATNPKQQTNVNNFAASLLNEKKLIPFGSVHPDAPDALQELERIKDMGLKGVKFHPDYQGFFADDEKMKPIYKKISSLGLITVFHAGMDIGFSSPFHCMPDNMRNALRWFDSPVIAAHWGGAGYSEEVIRKLCGLDLFFDISFGYGTMPKANAQKIIELHTPDKLVFGSDMPWHRPAWEMRLMESLDLSSFDKDKIFYKNATKLLNITNEE